MSRVRALMIVLIVTLLPSVPSGFELKCDSDNLNELIYKVSLIRLSPFEGQSLVTYECRAWRHHPQAGDGKWLRSRIDDMLRSYPKAISLSNLAKRNMPEDIRCPPDRCFKNGVISAEDKRIVCSRMPRDCQGRVELVQFEDSREEPIPRLDSNSQEDSNENRGTTTILPNIQRPQRIRNMHIGGYLVIGMGLLVFSTVLLIGCTRIRTDFIKHTREVEDSEITTQQHVRDYEVDENQADKIDVALYALKMKD